LLASGAGRAAGDHQAGAAGEETQSPEDDPGGAGQAGGGLAVDVRGGHRRRGLDVDRVGRRGRGRISAVALGRREDDLGGGRLGLLPALDGDLGPRGLALLAPLEDPDVGLLTGGPPAVWIDSGRERPAWSRRSGHRRKQGDCPRSCASKGTVPVLAQARGQSPFLSGGDGDRLGRFGLGRAVAGLGEPDAVGPDDRERDEDPDRQEARADEVGEVEARVERLVGRRAGGA
jgi:hypothetical protein